MSTTAEDPKIPAIKPELAENVAYITKTLGTDVSWDIIAKPFQFGGLNMMTYVANGFFLTMNMVLILDDLHKTIQSFVEKHRDNAYTMGELVNYVSMNMEFVQVQPVPAMSDAVRFILSGPMITFIDGFDQALLIDTRIYPMRSIDEPDLERGVRGSRDAFTETMLMNTSLIRRRIRDPRLRVELMQIGEVSQTDVSFIYMEGVTSPHLVDDMRKRLKSVKVDQLFMGEQSLIEHMGNVKWNPYPIVRYTERPDVAATALTEGQILIVVDTSPEVIIAPTALFHHLQNPQEYHAYPLAGSYTRWVILLAHLLSVLLPGVFLMMNVHPDFMPDWLSFFKATGDDPLPLWAELVVADVLLDLLRLAVLNTPRELASSVGIVAALLFGQFASKINLLQPEVLVYMGLVMLCQFATTSYELGTANQLARFWLIAWTAVFRGWGFIIACVAWLLLLATTRSFGIPYLWPLVPFKWKHGLREVLLRSPMQTVEDQPQLPFTDRAKR